jgi:hypothetical protein
VHLVLPLRDADARALDGTLQRRPCNTSYVHETNGSLDRCHKKVKKPEYRTVTALPLAAVL